MNIIPTIFNNIMPPYTAVGGVTRRGNSGLSAVVLSRGGRYLRRNLFQELEKVGFDYIISIEGSHECYDIEDLSSRFPHIRFILIKDRINTGEQINLAAAEVTTPFFFVLWSDVRILHSGGASRMVERLNQVDKRLCTVPIIQNAHFETLPTITVPGDFKGTFRPLLFTPNKDGESSLYPFDGVGIYDRNRFIAVGGFDTSIRNNYWQLVDFGFRSHLWGEKIQSSHLIRLSYNGETPPEDTTAEDSYRRFYLKNLALIFRADSASIPLTHFFGYWFHSGQGFFSAWADFSAARTWITTNRYRFRSDARALSELWEDIGEHPEIKQLPAGSDESVESELEE
ncbi:hypothetical protein FACS1894172_14350 [Spirochaetia bacterium]|nr:hypothetical protein FACS1894172_14350 [Spirochaetia bacterium]